jgi:PII-like signaling protein
VVEAVDIPDRIELAAAALDEMVVEGLVTIQDLTATRYMKDPKLER